MYTDILFDLDGTLIKSEEGIFKSIAYALEQMGRQNLGQDILKKFIGPPIAESFQTFCGLQREQALLATQYYRQRYAQVGIFECELYPGLKPLLHKLAKAGRGVHLATAKPTVYAVRILEHFEIKPLFSVIEGVPLEVGHYEKADIVQRVLDKRGVKPQNAVMVGDRHHDILGAKDCGVDGIGVLYGYGSREELTQAGASHLAENAEQLDHLLFGA
ncbi:HAD-IA family hydrolase [Ruminococcaceae bacterium OttesenSCG-928-I18]|nr:HAD-IA family hydrolase [Ruminococcaceae bacterium OttesenSCG-928-I18]